MKIHYADTAYTECYKEEVGNIAYALLGHRKAFLSDKSMLGDFLPCDGIEESNRKLAKISQKLGVPMTATDYVWEIAKKLRERKNAKA